MMFEDMSWRAIVCLTSAASLLGIALGAVTVAVDDADMDAREQAVVSHEREVDNRDAKLADRESWLDGRSLFLDNWTAELDERAASLCDLSPGAKPGKGEG